MQGKIQRSGTALLLFIALTFLFSLPLSAAPPATMQPDNDVSSRSIQSRGHLPPSSHISSASDAVIGKLSPDLRESIERPGDNSSRFVFIMVRPGTSVTHLLNRSAVGRPLGEVQWVTGEAPVANLVRLASLDGVIAVTSTSTYQPLPAPGLEEMRGDEFASLISSDQAAELLAQGGKSALLEQMKTDSTPVITSPNERPTIEPRGGDSVKTADIHRVNEAHAAGYTGQGVIAAVVDTGVDFAHPDLQGTQARVVGGPYDGWPFAYDTLSGANYAIDSFSRGPDNYWVGIANSQYVHTLPVEDAKCDGDTCTAELLIDYGELAGNNWPSVALDFTWSDTSQSGDYYYTVFPIFDHLFRGFLLGLGYASMHDAPAAVIVADESTPGVYDSVYVDADFDQDLVEEKPMRKGDELSGADLYDSAFGGAPDGYWDMSTSMLAWISDGANPPPGVSVLYGGVETPDAGRLLTFVSDAETHGTNVASMIAAQSIITDPDLMSSVNPLFAGGENAGGVGGPVLAGMAPDAQIAAFMNGFVLPLDAWTLAALGFDGVPESGDEAQIVNNSWGDSFETADGWDTTSRFAHYLNRNFTPTTTFLAATGNGGPGYGTTTSPNGGTIYKIGASTSYGSSDYFELVAPEQFTYGAVQPWSNRGPGSLGDVDPDLVCVGAFGLGATPLNRFPNGQAAYDLFGGTSMASPVCTGIAALGYQAFYEAHNRWPTWQETADMLSSGADDLGYNPLAQGAGNADALRTTAIAAGDAAYITPSQWLPGDYRGDDFTPAFPAIVHPGDTASTPLTLHNPTDAPVSLSLSDVTLRRVHEISFTVTLNAGNSVTDPIFLLPDYLQDITSLIDEHDPDLIRAHTLIPHGNFDTNNDYYPENTIRSLFYDWADLNEDGNLWVDSNENGLVDPEEIDVERGMLGAYEINRYTYAYANSPYDVVDVGRDALSRQHDGVFFGLQRRSGSDDLDVTVSLIFYKKADWDWLSLSANSVDVPANGEATVTATMAVPGDASVGLYEGAVEYDGQVLPVIVHVAADETTFEFGAASLDEPLGDAPHDNGHLFGSADWFWRPETGDWRHFFFDLPDGSSGPGTAMVVETEWVHPVPKTDTPPPPTILYEEFEGGIPLDWPILENVGSCFWGVNDPFSIPNYTGGAGLTATADSAGCGPETTMDTELHTPLLDLSAEDEVWLAFRTDFYTYYDEEGNPLDHGYVDVSTNGGADWTNVLDLDYPLLGPATIIQDLSAFAGEAEVIIRFRYVAPGWHAWWQVDEVGVYLDDPSPVFESTVPDMTDVNTAIFGAAEDSFSTGDPAFFGPSSVTALGASEDHWLSGGTWRFHTATGGPREVVGAPTRDGLGFITLHNVLNAGRIVGEPVVGRAYQLTVDPAPLEAEADTVASVDPLMVAAEWDVSVESTADIAEGLRVTGFGPSIPGVFTDQPISQDDPSNACTANWVEEVVIQDGGLLAATMTASMSGLDVDLYLARDGGDGVFDCIDESLVVASATNGSEESLRVQFPPDGRYWVIAHGWSVPDGSGRFDLTIEAIQGRNIIAQNVPAGPVVAGEPLTFDLTAQVPHRPGTAWSGILFIGPTDAPTALTLPVTVTVPQPKAGELVTRFSAAPDALETGEEAAFSLWVWNRGGDEAVSAAITIPPGLAVAPGSVQATVGQAFFNILGRRITWEGVLPAGEHMTITFDATAATMSGRADVGAQVNGLIRNTEAQHTLPIWINTAAPPRVIYLPAAVGN